ncbi:MAG: glycosyltransferase family A protein [Eubacteriales bacterium]|nr:glycosyltransferase family A protein [Eubacteriales bacterium]
MKLSIVVSAYNVENHIKRTLNTMIGQTTKQFELIVVDDGSTDGTYNQIKEILEESYNGNYKIITKKNGGAGSARNRGLMEASGEFVMFLDGDDYVADKLVENIYDSLDSLKSREVDVVCWGYNTVNEEKSVLINYFDIYKQINKPITGTEALRKILNYRTMWVCTGSMAFRKNFLNEYRLKYTEGCSNGEDQEFAYKALSKANNVVFINTILLFYVQRKGSISNSYNIEKFDVIDALKRTCYYFKKSNDKDLIKLADIIEIREMAENYFNNLNTCMTNSNIKPLLNEINEKYPNLNIEIKKAMRQYKRGKNKIAIKCKLFLISPNLYAKSVFLKRKIIAYKKG